MRALVIGGNRFVGKRLVQILLGRGLEVTLLNRGLMMDDFGGAVKRIVLDRRNLRKDHPALGTNDWDIVFDMVCFDAVEAQNACRAFYTRTKRYVFVSSQSVYELGPSLTEESFDPRVYQFQAFVNFESDYGEAKRQAEATFFQKAEFSVTSVRFPFVLGEDDYTGRLKFHIRQCIEEKPIRFPNLSARISFVHSPDAARFLSFLVDYDFEGPINCCSPEPISIRSLMELMCGSTCEQGVLSPFGIESDWYMNIGRLLKLGFNPTPLEQWLPKLIADLMVDEIQNQSYSRMSFSQKMTTVHQLREVAWAMKIAGIRAQHPEWSDQEVHREVRKIFLYATT